ncbi:hypothetical protein SCLCIDRAFT_108197, partial [Scleroderma citrinum Foug A]
QLPVVVQMAIFLFHVEHYRNAVSPEDISQWAGVSIGSVVNCTNCVMIAILEEHDQFISIPSKDSEDMEKAQVFIESYTCPAWKNSIFAADG